MQMDSANTVCKDASVICPVTFSLPALRSTTRLQEAKQNPQFPGGTLAELCDCCLWFNQHSSLTAGDPSFVVCVLQAHTHFSYILYLLPWTFCLSLWLPFDSWLGPWVPLQRHLVLALAHLVFDQSYGCVSARHLSQVPGSHRQFAFQLIACSQ